MVPARYARWRVSIQSLVERDTSPCSSDHSMNPNPASPSHKVPSQSNTATLGFKFKTLCCNSSAVHWAVSNSVVLTRFSILLGECIHDHSLPSTRDLHVNGT